MDSSANLPLGPAAPPFLEEFKNEAISLDKGLFSINLTEAVGGRIVQDPYLTGFLFKIHDIATRNFTYIWQVKFVL